MPYVRKGVKALGGQGGRGVTDRLILSDGTAVTMRRSARARRMTLRVSGRDGTVTLTIPPSLDRAEALAFAQSRAGWLERAMAAAPRPVPVALGVAMPVEGRPLTLTAAVVRAPQIDGDRLLLPQGAPAAATAAGFLRTLAQARLMAACDRHAGALGRGYRAIALRDTRSRWGSCTADGRLMFSWRLAMAPPEVLDYVAAHEVAHLAHMDHSPRFWAAVERICPGYAPCRAWLRREGAALHGWQFRAAMVGAGAGGR